MGHTDDIGTGLERARGLYLNLRAVSGRVVMSGAERQFLVVDSHVLEHVNFGPGFSRVTAGLQVSDCPSSVGEQADEVLVIGADPEIALDVLRELRHVGQCDWIWSHF